jgi:hypothetical protein
VCIGSPTQLRLKFGRGYTIALKCRSTPKGCGGGGVVRDTGDDGGSSGSSNIMAGSNARCAFFDRNLHSRMPLVPTPARLKRAGV